MYKRITGLGGVFFRTDDPAALREWYGRHLGLPHLSKYGAAFEWRDADGDDPTLRHTVWSPFSRDNDYFPAGQNCMFNFRVENLAELLATLRAEGVEVFDEIEEYDYGKFGWIKDPQGNKIELWEPNDAVFREVNGWNSSAGPTASPEE